MTKTLTRRERPSTGERHSVHFSGVELEIRTHSGSKVDIEGYAATYDVEYEIAGGPPYGWIESIDQEAGKATLADNPDVVLLLNHGDLPLARTKPKTLELSEDSKGLHHRAKGLDMRDPDVARIIPKIERGDVDEMSFAFRTERQSWDEDMERRWIEEYNLNRGDVSYVTFGANPDTSIDMRALEALTALAGVDPSKAFAEIRAAHAGDPMELITRARKVLEAISETGGMPKAGGMPDASRGGMPLDLAQALAVG